MIHLVKNNFILCFYVRRLLISKLFPTYVNKNESFLNFSIFIVFHFQKKFPIDNLAEWNHNNNPLGLRCMHVYVLVFDMGNLDTFQVSFFSILILNEKLFFCRFEAFRSLNIII